jgi:hypothetical protein
MPKISKIWRLERFRFSSTPGRQGEARGAYSIYVSTVSPQSDDV